MENQFRQYPLEEDILGALDALGYTQPTEIQAAVIPSILNGRDIIAKSKTGSGKTAAFAIPICNFADWEQNTAQALVLEPTRELAFQVKDELYAIGRFKRLKVPVLYGGFPMEKQILTLKQKTHIVVGTPGRVLDHCKRGTLDLSKVRYVVIDEADLMLDMGRTSRQREVIDKMLQQAKVASPSALLTAVRYACPNINTTLSNDELFALAADVNSYSIIDTEGFPYTYDLTLGTLGVFGVKDSLVCTDLAGDVKKLHTYLFGDDGYEVKDISYTIQKAFGVGQ